MNLNYAVTEVQFSQIIEQFKEVRGDRKLQLLRYTAPRGSRKPSFLRIRFVGYLPTDDERNEIRQALVDIVTDVVPGITEWSDEVEAVAPATPSQNTDGCDWLRRSSAIAAADRRAAASTRRQVQTMRFGRR